MVQAHARELLNQKESENDSSVTGFSDHPLYKATERLITALERLESKLQNNQQSASLERSREAQQHEQIRLFERENNTLKAEHEKLNAAINQLQGEYGDLHEVASTIYTKLEDSIKRLTQIIEN